MIQQTFLGRGDVEDVVGGEEAIDGDLGEKTSLQMEVVSNSSSSPATISASDSSFSSSGFSCSITTAMIRQTFLGKDDVEDVVGGEGADNRDLGRASVEMIQEFT